MRPLHGPHLTLRSKERGISTFLTYWYLRGNETKLRLTLFPKAGSLPLEWSLFFPPANSPATHRADVRLLLLLPAFTSQSVLQFSHSSRDLPCPSLFIPLLGSGLWDLMFLTAPPALPASAPPTSSMHSWHSKTVFIYINLAEKPSRTVSSL